MKNKKFLIFGVLLAVVFFGGLENVKAQYDCDGMDCTSDEYDQYYAGTSDNAYECGGTPCTSDEYDQYYSNSVDNNYGCPANSTTDSGGTCVCNIGYTPDSDGICIASSNFDKNGNVSTTCDPDPSCKFYNCCAVKDTTITQTSDEIAAAKKKSRSG